ncbi:MAG: hydrogenase maturation protease [Candidatus Omnitrophica bacterium]|nr:hydrogenase maturation protease [Candidatus Omnitrophota bacterium]
MRHLAFDLGRVLFDFDYSIALDKIKDKLGVPVEKAAQELVKNDFPLDFEKGLLSAQEFYIKFKQAFKTHLTYEEFVDAWSDIFTPKKEVIGLIERLQYVYPVYLISNINELHFEHLHERHPEIFRLFDTLLLSYKIKSVKPETKIYAELKKISGAQYTDILYIDDREDLIREAKKLHLQCIRFDELNQLKKDLTHAGIHLPTESETDTLRALKDSLKASPKSLIVGLGNVLRGDDAVGINIIRGIDGKVRLKTLDAGVSLENYLSPIKKSNADTICIIDAAEFNGPDAFKLFTPHDIKNLSLGFTHDASLSLAIEYLQKEMASDILLCAVRNNKRALGQEMSAETKRAQNIIGNFFLKNFPKTA